MELHVHVVLPGRDELRCTAHRQQIFHFFLYSSHTRGSCVEYLSRIPDIAVAPCSHQYCTTDLFFSNRARTHKACASCISGTQPSLIGLPPNKISPRETATRNLISPHFPVHPQLSWVLATQPGEGRGGGDICYPPRAIMVSHLPAAGICFCIYIVHTLEIRPNKKQCSMVFLDSR